MVEKQAGPDTYNIRYLKFYFLLVWDWKNKIYELIGSNWLTEVPQLV